MKIKIITLTANKSKKKDAGEKQDRQLKRH